MSTSSLCVIVTVLVLKLHHPGPQPHRVPRWIRIVFLGFLSNLVKCKCGKRRRKHRKDRAGLSLTDSLSNIDYTETSSIFTNNHGNSYQGRKFKYSEEIQNKRAENKMDFDMQERHESESNIDDLMCHLGHMVSQSDKTEVELEAIDEWRQVARVADRVAFVVFLFITLFSASVVLVVIPCFVYDEKGGI